ncbi:D-alanyl-D-alanine carboxypeptidase [Halorhodospira halochloris]|uniref:D-alanyl-D-alanine carboxypeptidase n=1 Tax=Halorhodospira halochloris TaxID=1052 RepID=A0A0X8XAU4_HALHR|nr:serine hydrolase domain-containing protein [Halorhodospira halochloris]BAU58641.1 D-alanyl-D-alanine carboxypeptidase [Halorhodospira halochloris]
MTLANKMVDSIQLGRVPPAVNALLESTVQDLAAVRGVRHAIVGVEAGDCSYRWIGAAGSADATGGLMTAQTPYFLASVTKLYIGAAVLRLHEQGQLSIDDSLIYHLPARQLSGLHMRRGIDRTAELTLRHLLGHTSGLPEYIFAAPKGKKALLDRVLEQDDLSWNTADVIEMARAAGEAHFNPRPFDDNRHTIRYSDTNFQLLMAVIEAATRRPIHEAFARLIYEPLGLTQTWHPGTHLDTSTPLAALPWAGAEPLDKPLALQSFRDLFSTADETLIFLRALITGELFDDPATAGLMWQHWNPFKFSLIRRAPSWPIEYGLAMMRFKSPRFLEPFIYSPPLIGHTGLSGSWLFYAPDADLYLTGTVDQLTAPAVPFKWVPQLVKELRTAGSET